MNILPRGVFPSQAVSNAEKASEKYGLEIARAVESEWFKRDSGTARYYANRDNFHRLRLYARGEQSIQKYKDELSINGDLSYLNIDWKPVPIIPKFVDIVVNGIAERTYDVKAYSQDPASVQKRTDYVESLLKEIFYHLLNLTMKKTILIIAIFLIANAVYSQTSEEYFYSGIEKFDSRNT